MEIYTLLPAGSCITLLPRSQNARLYLSGETPLIRWHESAMYPGFRRTARVYRLLQRLKAALGFCHVIENPSQHWALKDYLIDFFPDVCSSVVLVGTPGPVQKNTVQVWDPTGVVGYIKYAEKPKACARLEREYQLLRTLPVNIGPQVIKYGSINKGMGLFLTPVSGKQLPPTLFPSKDVLAFLETFKISKPVILEEHPWVNSLHNQFDQEVKHWLSALSHRKWPIVFYHGDFSPWNIFHTPDGNLRVIDWEYGTPFGLPYLDLIYYILQVAHLIYGHTPKMAQSYALDFLVNAAKEEVTTTEAQALVKLSAFNAFQQFFADGHPHDSPHQIWWKRVWEV